MFATCSQHFRDIFATFSRHFRDIFATFSQHIRNSFGIFSQHFEFLRGVLGSGASQLNSLGQAEVGLVKPTQEEKTVREVLTERSITGLYISVEDESGVEDGTPILYKM